jgi:hypothetical protein
MSKGPAIQTEGNVSFGESLEIGSGSVSLQIAVADRHVDGRPAYLNVRVGDGSASASLRVYIHVADDLVAFFADLACAWRGWPGEKAWSSVEGDFKMTATNDGRGHVSLLVALKPQVPQPPWAFQATVPLEAGELDRIAAGARDLNAG